MALFDRGSEFSELIAQTSVLSEDATIDIPTLVLAKRSIIDVPTVLLALGTLALLWKFKKLPEPVIVAAAAVIGLIVYPFLHR